MFLDKFKKNKSLYNCFYDSEFNAYDDAKSQYAPQEVVSIGVCITNDNGVIIEKFYSLIALKVARRISNRCTEITGIRTKDLRDAESFDNVAYKVFKLLKKYDINRIYCYGLEDKRMFDKTLELYERKKYSLKISQMLYDIRQDFKKKTKGKVGDQGLQFLKSICHIEGGVIHDALQDAIDLALVYHKLNNYGYDVKLYEELTREREEISNYKRNRRIKEENANFVNRDLAACKEKLVDYLKTHDIPNLDVGAKRAFIDDMNLLFMGE